MKTGFIFFFLLVFLNGIGQKAVFRFTMQGIGDNREFHNGFSRPQTIFGTLGSAEIGTSADGHSVFAGISELYEFGSTITFHQPALILYYKLEKPGYQFRFGSFSRRETINFPLAMLADTLLCYRPLIEGMAGKTEWNWGNQSGFVDWTGRQTKTVRESFMAGISGEINLQRWFLEDYFLLHHLAHSLMKPEGQHIKDYFGFALLAGRHLGNAKTFTGQIKGGLLASLYRERSVTEGFLKSSSFYFEGIGRISRYAVKTTFHSGTGHHFALGDPLYRSASYLRTDAIWYFLDEKKIKARFNWSFHMIDWKKPDHSQQLFLLYEL